MVNYEICVSSRKQRDISQLTKMVKCEICFPYYKSGEFRSQRKVVNCEICVSTYWQREILQLTENGEVRDLYSFI